MATALSDVMQQHFAPPDEHPEPSATEPITQQLQPRSAQPCDDRELLNLAARTKQSPHQWNEGKQSQKQHDLEWRGFHKVLVLYARCGLHQHPSRTFPKRTRRFKCGISGLAARLSPVIFRSRERANISAFGMVAVQRGGEFSGAPCDVIKPAVTSRCCSRGDRSSSSASTAFVCSPRPGGGPLG